MIKTTKVSYWEVFVGYARLAREADLRIAIEAALRAGACPANDGTMGRERFRLVVIQEHKRIKKQTIPFSCGCEGSTALANMEPEEEDAYILSIPSEEDEIDVEERVAREELE